MAYSLAWCGRAVEADLELATLDALSRTDAQRAQAAIARVTTLALTLGRPAEAKTVLDAIASAISDDAAAMELAATRSVLDAFLGRTVQAAAAAAWLLGDP